MFEISLTPADWIVFCVYLATVTTIGIVASFRIKSTVGYFLGNRRFGKWTMIAQSFGTGTHAEMPVSLAGIVFSQGISGIWYQWKNLFVTPFYWILAPLFRRFRRTTLGEVVEDRYGPWFGAIYTVFALIFFSINLASMLKGAGKVISQSVGGNLPVDEIVVAMTVVFVAYSFFGGLVASAWTDLVQGLLIIVLSFLLLPLGWHVVGGLGGMKTTLGADHFFLTTPRGINFWFVTVLTLNGLIGIVAQPHLIAAVGTGRDEETCRVGQFCGNFVKRVCTTGWAIVGVMVATMIARGVTPTRSLADPEEAFGFACRHLLFPGGLGLLIACLLAANMAGCSAFMVNSGALVTNNLYRRYFRPACSDRHYVWVGRFSGLATTVAAATYAVFFIKGVLYSFLLTETLATYFGVSILGGILWRRANRYGAGASILASLLVNFGLYAATHQRLDAWNPNIFLAALCAGIVTLVVVSLLTPAEPAGRLDTFFENLQTPSDNEADLVRGERPDPGRLAAEGRQLLLPNLLHLRENSMGHGILRSYRHDLRGLGVGCGLVALLIAALWLCLR